MKRVARLVRRVGRKLRSLAPEPRDPTPPGVPLTLVDGFGAANDVWCAPAFGVVIDDEGRVSAETAREAQAFTPDLSRLPHVHREDGASVFSPPADTPVVSRATVFAGWSGLHNYAQFVLASLPALLATEDTVPPIVPPLTPWQADLLDLAGRSPIVTDAPLVRLGEAVIAEGGGFPDPRALELRDRVLATVTPADAPRIYVSRRDALKTTMIDEAWVEEALTARGFTIVRPETSSVRELIALFAGAEVIAGPTGATLANVLFCAPGAKVLEIRPPEAPESWVRALAGLVGADWSGFEAAGPRETVEVPLDPRLRPASAYAWRTGEALHGFLDAVL